MAERICICGCGQLLVNPWKRQWFFNRRHFWRWYQQQDRYKAYQATYREKHREELKAYHREYGRL